MARYNKGLGDLPKDRNSGPYEEVVGYGGPSGPAGVLGSQGSKSNYVNNVAMNNRNYAITDVSSRILPANRKRKYLIMVNTGGNTVYVSFTNVNNVENSVPILPGGNYEPWIIPFSEVNALCEPGLVSSLVVAEGFVEGV